MRRCRRRINKLIVVSFIFLGAVFLVGFKNVHNLSFLSNTSLDSTITNVEDGKFTVIVLPDTQYYSQNYPEHFCKQTQWIVDNREKLNIVFVSHLGDIVQNGFSEKQWKVADKCMKILDDARIPYGIVPGNHDSMVVSDNLSGFALYDKYFGVERFMSNGAFYDWYKGNFKNNQNSYQSLKINGKEIVFLNLEPEPTLESLEWAENIVKENKDAYIILTTHSYLRASTGTRFSSLQFNGGGKPDYLGNPAKVVWEKLVKRNCEINMVWSGHAYNQDGSGERILVSKNDCGKNVHQILQDYQYRGDGITIGPGGNGLLRIYQFNKEIDEVNVSTFSAVTGKYEDDDDSKFTLKLKKDYTTQCGTAARNYTSLDSSYGSDSQFCLTGNPEPNIPAFPGSGGSIKWVCNGQNGETINATCTATKSKTVLTAITDIIGTPQVGILLTAGDISPAGATVKYQWKQADTATETYRDIPGAIYSGYTLLTADEGKFIRVSVSGTGSYKGTVSAPVIGPVIGVPVITDTVPGVPDIESEFDLGVSNSDNSTTVTQPRFTVSCTSGTTVHLYSDNIYDNATLIGTAPCVAGTAQIIPIQPLSSGVHTLTAKQSINGTTSAASGALTLTIDVAPLTVTFARAAEQSEPATSSTIKFTATFSRPIDPNSFICSDVTVVNGTCTSVALLSGNMYMVTVTATTQGQVKVVLYPGRVQTDAGNLNAEATGVNTVTYGSITPTAQCSSLRRFTTSNPGSSSLNGETLCTVGNPTNVSYNSSDLEWTYQCRNTVDGSTSSCTVDAILDLAPTCEAQELPFGECSLDRTGNLYFFYEYLDCLGVAEQSSCNRSYGCPQEAKRQELVYIADQLRGIPLDENNYECQGNHTDTERGVASWVCEAAEKAQIADLISATNTKFRPTDTMTRAEAYSVLMKSICVHPDTDSRNWQTKVAQEAKEHGFTVRTVSTFEPNKLILRQELYALAARIAEYKDENGDECDDLPDELICEE